MSFRQSYADLKPIATTVIVIANDSALWRLRLASSPLRVKLFGACKLRLKATHSIYQRLSSAAIAEFCNSSRTMNYLYDLIGLRDLLFLCFPRKLPLLTS